MHRKECLLGEKYLENLRVRGKGENATIALILVRNKNHSCGYEAATAAVVTPN
jgi:hypothetical protein